MVLAGQQVAIAFEQAEKERLDICMRVKDGMRAAKLAAAEQGIEKHYGLRKGAKLVTRKNIVAKVVIRKYSKDFGGTLKDADVIKLCGISRNTDYFLYKGQLKGGATVMRKKVLPSERHGFAVPGAVAAGV